MVEGESAYLKVTSLSEVKTIIDIFSTYPLNSNKHLKFLAFREAYELYILPQNKPRDEIIQEISIIKNTMNSKRVYCEINNGSLSKDIMDNPEICITDN